MSENPQITAYRQAAAAMKAERYWDHGENPDEQIEFLAVLGDVLTEVGYQLDKYQVLHRGGMDAYRAAAGLEYLAVVSSSAELLLTTALEQRKKQVSNGKE